MAGYLPLEFNTGLLMIYNVRQRSIINHLEAPNGFNWGSIYQISPFGIYSAVVGQSVLFKGSEAICQLAVGRHQFPIIEEAKIVTTELESLA